MNTLPANAIIGYKFCFSDRYKAPNNSRESSPRRLALPLGYAISGPLEALEDVWDSEKALNDRRRSIYSIKIPVVTGHRHNRKPFNRALPICPLQVPIVAIHKVLNGPARLAAFEEEARALAQVSEVCDCIMFDCHASRSL